MNTALWLAVGLLIFVGLLLVWSEARSFFRRRAGKAKALGDPKTDPSMEAVACWECGGDDAKLVPRWFVTTEERCFNDPSGFEQRRRVFVCLRHCRGGEDTPVPLGSAAKAPGRGWRWIGETLDEWTERLRSEGKSAPMISWWDDVLKEAYEAWQSKKR